MNQRVTKVYFDGGCRPNPGPIESAVVIRGVVDMRRSPEVGGSELAEWQALLHALDIAAARGERDIIVIGDSLPVIRQARGEQPCRSAATRALHDCYAEAVAGFDRVRLRHSGRAQNLAGIALEKARWARPAR